jgi:alpha-tubulin suppressor-like RCC1 family protein
MGHLAYPIAFFAPTKVLGLVGEPVQVATASYRTCVLSDLGAVQCFGRNVRGESGAPQGVEYQYSPYNVTGIRGKVKEIALSSDESCALTQTGEVYCWGSQGWEGLYKGVSRIKGFAGTPVKIQALSSAATCALLDTGAVQCWGRNASGQLGIGSDPELFVEKTVPTSVNGLAEPAVDLTALQDGFCAHQAGGELRCWGSGFAFGRGPDKNVLTATPMTFRPLYGLGGATCGFQRDKKLRCIGTNNPATYSMP